MKSAFSAVFAFVLLIVTVPLSAAEEIRSYSSNIVVRADGVVEITETITVNAEGRNIRRGIFRDFPTDYEDQYGNNIKAGFKVMSVRRGGSSEPYDVSNYANGKRVRIGSADHILSRGEHTYEIMYETTWQVTHLEATDELYFNAIGHGWAFPIESATVSVRVPEGAVIDRAEGHAGSFGSKAWQITPERIANNMLVYQLNRSLGREQGFTMLLEWPAGFVVRPTGMDNAERFLRDNLHVFIGSIGLLLLLAYFYVAWSKAGRDPKAGTIIARYGPPEGISPGLARSIRKLGADHTAYTAAIVNMAVKGYLTIDQTGDDVRLERTGGSVALSPGEKTLAKYLFRGFDSVTMGSKHSEDVRESYLEFCAKLKDGEGRFFSLNRHLLVGGVLIAAVAELAMFINEPTPTHFVFIGLYILICLVFAYLLKARTRYGRKILDMIEGFRDYLEVAEKGRLNFHHAPELTPEIFEEYLPYAIALDVENEWADQFDSAMSRIGKAEAYEQPHWYRGRRSTRFRSRAFVGAVSGSLASTIASASSPPASSGSSGFSGGGGGW